MVRMDNIRRGNIYLEKSRVLKEGRAVITTQQNANRGKGIFGPLLKRRVEIVPVGDKYGRTRFGS